jgi:hypothetical protein
MKRKISCLCENVFSEDIPEEIDLDRDARYLDEIENGVFMNFNCPACGKLHKPEFPLTVLWPAKNLRFEVIPEQERMGFYRRKTEKEKGGKTQALIGYLELADRLAVARDGLEPAVIESLKYYLYLKAGETNPDNEVTIWYHGKIAEAETGADGTADTALEFRIRGLKENSVALTRLPFSLYKKTAADYARHPRAELFASLRHGNYLSVQNMMLPPGLK